MRTPKLILLIAFIVLFASLPFCRAATGDIIFSYKGTSGATTSVVTPGATTDVLALNGSGIVTKVARATWLTPTGNGASLTGLTKGQVGLGNVENTALSTWTGSTSVTTLGIITAGTWRGTAVADTWIASAATWNAKQAAITTGTTAQYLRGDLSLATLNASAVGLALVENTALSTWTGSTNLGTLGIVTAGTWRGAAVADTWIASAAAWNAKQAAITTGTTAQYFRGDLSLASLNSAAVGLGLVENTALSTWGGNANITALGVVTSGTFSGTLGAISGAPLTGLNASNLASGTLSAARLPAFTGDATTSAGSAATTLATVNGNIGSFTNGSFTVNAKGLITAAASGAASEVPLTFGTGLTRSTNTITVNPAQNIATLSNLTANGFVKTTGGTGTLSIDSTAYLTNGSAITAAQMPAFTGDITTTAGAVATTLATVNPNVGSFTAASITVDGKGRITAAAPGPLAFIAATGTLTLVGNAIAAEAVTIGVRTYTWRASVGATANEVLLGATAADSIVNLAAAINGSAGSGTLYGSATAAHPQISAAAGASTLVATASSIGAAANALATTETMTNGSFGAATLTGGYGLTITPSTGTLTVANGTTLTGPGSTGTIALLGTAQTWSAAQTHSTEILITANGPSTYGLSLSSNVEARFRGACRTDYGISEAFGFGNSVSLILSNRITFTNGAGTTGVYQFGNSYNGGTAGASTIRASDFNGTNINANMLVLASGNSTGTGTSTVQIHTPTDQGSSGSTVNVAARRMTISAAGVSMQGSVYADSAAAGDVGQIVTALVASGSAATLTSATGANALIGGISLTAGDWDVSGVVTFKETAATVTARKAGITTTSATVPSDGREAYDDDMTTAISGNRSITLPPMRISLSSTTTVFMAVEATFSAGVVATFGRIQARRVR